MGIISFVFTLFGCSKKPVKISRPQEKCSSVSISQSHMDRTYCYHFWARQENGSYLLDAECIIADYDNNDFAEINLTDTAITEDDFRQFTEIDSKYDFYSHIKTKTKKSYFFVYDETITNFYVEYGEEGFYVETSGECYSAVCNCFFELAKKYSENTV